MPANFDFIFNSVGPITVRTVTLCVVFVSIRKITRYVSFNLTFYVPNKVSSSYRDWCLSEMVIVSSFINLVFVATLFLQ